LQSVNPVEAFGACPKCGLRFAGEPDDHPALGALVRLHLGHCAGGDRSSEEWVPYREVYESRRCHVLLVDSDPFTRDALRTLLQLEGHAVEEASDGPKAVELAVTREPDVMLIDINLPGFDGYQVARRIQAARLPHPPFLVALTGYGRPGDRRRAREAGFDEYLLKPAEAEEIERVVAAGRLRSLRQDR
jgi:CheY-like chemotaxis protein